MKKINCLTWMFLVILFAACSSSKTPQKDGLSIETAIKVNSVEQEYQLLPKLCSGCKMKSQALSSKGKRYYDVMTMIKPSGETVAYYFDITSFYGRF